MGEVVQAGRRFFMRGSVMPVKLFEPDAQARGETPIPRLRVGLKDFAWRGVFPNETRLMPPSLREYRRG